MGRMLASVAHPSWSYCKRCVGMELVRALSSGSNHTNSDQKRPADRHVKDQAGTLAVAVWGRAERVKVYSQSPCGPGTAARWWDSSASPATQRPSSSRSDPAAAFTWYEISSADLCVAARCCGRPCKARHVPVHDGPHPTKHAMPDRMTAPTTASSRLGALCSWTAHDRPVYNSVLLCSVGGMA